MFSLVINYPGFAEQATEKAMLELLLLGLIIGMHHALEADHLAAVATLVSKEQDLDKRKAMHHGVFWGIGHTLTLFLVGMVFLALDSLVPDNLAQNLEFLVGLMLIGLGGHVIYRLYRDRIHFHYHKHAGTSHFHAHSHRGEPRHTHSVQHEHSHDIPVRSLLVGLMHGLAGSAVLIMLTLDAFDDIVLGAIYILLFGIGSIVGMALLSVIISIPMKASQRLTKLNAGLTLSIGFLTMSLGFFTVIEQTPF